MAGTLVMPAVFNAQLEHNATPPADYLRFFRSVLRGGYAEVAPYLFFLGGSGSSGGHLRHDFIHNLALRADIKMMVSRRPASNYRTGAPAHRRHFPIVRLGTCSPY